jgi:hypothetical protein
MVRVLRKSKRSQQYNENQAHQHAFHARRPAFRRLGSSSTIRDCFSVGQDNYRKQAFTRFDRRSMSAMAIFQQTTIYYWHGVIQDFFKLVNLTVLAQFPGGASLGF